MSPHECGPCAGNEALENAADTSQAHPLSVREQVWERDRSQTAAAGDTEEMMAPALARTALGWADSILCVEATGTGTCRLLGGF